METKIHNALRARSSRVSTVFHHLSLQGTVKSFLVKNTKIKNTKFPYKTFPSIANVKINSMGSTKWTYHRDRSFASNYFIFWKFCFSLGTPFKELIWRTNYPNIHIQTFCICWSYKVLFHQELPWWYGYLCYFHFFQFDFYFGK